jgi:hypothetical protein
MNLIRLTLIFSRKPHRLRLNGEKTVWKAERALRGAKRRSNPSKRERRAKPGIEPLLTRWGKSGVFLNHSA